MIGTYVVLALNVAADVWLIWLLGSWDASGNWRCTDDRTADTNVGQPRGEA